MSYKNAMAGLPLGGGKGVILADEGQAKTPELLAAFGRAVESLGGAYVTAEDVGMSVADMVEIARATRHVSGLPAAGDAVGGNPSPLTALRSEEHTSELQSLMRISYAVFCLNKK